MPCSSGNSPTMSVTRSALASMRRALGVRRRRRRCIGAIAVGEHAQALARARAACRACCDRRSPRAVGTRVVERRLAVLVEEERGVGEPRAQHALVALDDRRGIARLDVADDRKRWTSLPPASASAKYFWFCCIVRIRHSCGTSRNAAIERAGVDGGPFDQRRHFVEQRVGHDDRGAAGGLSRAPRRSARGARRSSRSPCLRRAASPRRRRRSRSRCRRAPRKRWPSVMRPASSPSAVDRRRRRRRAARAAGAPAGRTCTSS